MEANDVKRMLNGMADNVIDNEKQLCDLDAYVGDGDHGRTVARGFRAVKEYLETCQETSISDILNKGASILGKSLGGAIGPIFQSIFAGFASATRNKEAVDVACLAEMFEEGLKKAMLIGGAKEGDKTLIDTLAPVSRSLRKSAEEGKNLKEAANVATQVAKEACESTTQMVAKKGRAKFLGEQSIGHQDAGATTMYFVVKAISDTL